MKETERERESERGREERELCAVIDFQSISQRDSGHILCKVRHDFALSKADREEVAV